jgi:hypothetical protein
MRINYRYSPFLAHAAILALAGCQKKEAAPAAGPAMTASPAMTAAPAGVKQATAAGVTFEWKFDGSNMDITLRAQTTGWIGVAFDPTTLMKGANFIIGYVKDGKAVVADHYGNQLTSHAPDTSLGGQDNVSNVSGKEENGVTELHFTIPLDSGDKYDKPIGPGKHTVLLAHGDADDFATQHKPDARAKIVLEL